jgi:hypothetical protein
MVGHEGLKFIADCADFWLCPSGLAVPHGIVNTL